MECKTCGSTSFSQQDYGYVCNNCYEVKADVREEDDSDEDKLVQAVRANKRDRRHIVNIGPKKVKEHKKKENSKIHYGDEHGIVKNVSNVLIQMAIAVAQDGVGKQDDIIENLRLLWLRWIGMARDAECYSYKARLQKKRPPHRHSDNSSESEPDAIQNEEGKVSAHDVETVALHDAVVEAPESTVPATETTPTGDVALVPHDGVETHESIVPVTPARKSKPAVKIKVGINDGNYSSNLPVRLGYPKRHRIWSVKPSVIMGRLVPNLSKDLCLSLLWMALVNSLVPLLPTDVALMQFHGPLVRLLRELSDALPKPRKRDTHKNAFEDCREVWPTGATIQATAAALVHSHGFELRPMDARSLVDALVVDVGMVNMSKGIRASALAILDMATFEEEQRKAKHHKESEELGPEKATHIEITNSQADVNGLYVKCGKYNKQPFYQRRQADGKPRFVWVADPLKTCWVATRDFFAETPIHESWSSLNKIGTAKGMITFKSVSTCRALSPRQLEISKCVNLEANGIYTLCGNHNEMPMYLKFDTSEKPLCLYYFIAEEKTKEGWVAGVHPAIATESSVYDFWRDLSLRGRHEGIIYICKSMIGEQAQKMRTPHPLQQSEGYPADVRAAAAVVAASRLTTLFIDVNEDDDNYQIGKFRKIVEYMKNEEGFDPITWACGVCQTAGKKGNVLEEFAEVLPDGSAVAVAKCKDERWRALLEPPRSSAALTKRLVGSIRGWESCKLVQSALVEKDIQRCASYLVCLAEAHAVEMHKHNFSDSIPKHFPALLQPQITQALGRRIVADTWAEYRSVLDTSAIVTDTSANVAEEQEDAYYTTLTKRKKPKKIRSKAKRALRRLVEVAVERQQLRTVSGEVKKHLRGWNRMQSSFQPKHALRRMVEIAVEKKELRTATGELKTNLRAWHKMHSRFKRKLNCDGNDKEAAPRKKPRKTIKGLKRMLTYRGISLKCKSNASKKKLERICDLADRLKVLGIRVPSYIAGAEDLESLLPTRVDDSTIVPVM